MECARSNTVRRKCTLNWNFSSRRSLLIYSNTEVLQWRRLARCQLIVSFASDHRLRGTRCISYILRRISYSFRRVQSWIRPVWIWNRTTELTVEHQILYTREFTMRVLYLRVFIISRIYLYVCALCYILVPVAQVLSWVYTETCVVFFWHWIIYEFMLVISSSAVLDTANLPYNSSEDEPTTSNCVLSPFILISYRASVLWTQLW